MASLLSEVEFVDSNYKTMTSQLLHLHMMHEMIAQARMSLPAFNWKGPLHEGPPPTTAISARPGLAASHVMGAQTSPVKPQVRVHLPVPVNNYQLWSVVISVDTNDNT